MAEPFPLSVQPEIGSALSLGSSFCFCVGFALWQQSQTYDLELAFLHSCFIWTYTRCLLSNPSKSSHGQSPHMACNLCPNSSFYLPCCYSWHIVHIRISVLNVRIISLQTTFQSRPMFNESVSDIWTNSLCAFIYLFVFRHEYN